MIAGLVPGFFDASKLASSIVRLVLFFRFFPLFVVSGDLFVT